MPNSKGRCQATLYYGFEAIVARFCVSTLKPVHRWRSDQSGEILQFRVLAQLSQWLPFWRRGVIVLSCIGCIVLSKCVVLSSYSACPDYCQVDRLCVVLCWRCCVGRVYCVVPDSGQVDRFCIERSVGVATPQCVVCGVTTAGERCCCAAG